MYFLISTGYTDIFTAEILPFICKLCPFKSDYCNLQTVYNPQRLIPSISTDAAIVSCNSAFNMVSREIWSLALGEMSHGKTVGVFDKTWRRSSSAGELVAMHRRCFKLSSVCLEARRKGVIVTWPGPPPPRGREGKAYGRHETLIFQGEVPGVFPWGRCGRFAYSHKSDVS